MKGEKDGRQNGVRVKTWSTERALLKLTLPIEEDIEESSSV